MKVSGFTFARNADKLYIPIKESILSVLPLVDEFVIAMGDNDDADRTEEIVNSIGSDKIKIVRTVWDKTGKYLKNTEYAHQTDIAMQACTGDWLIYIQGDEAIHEKDYEEIRSSLERYYDDDEVEGFLFNYNHFWGDYDHAHRSHGWYKHEIRIIRNKPDVHSWKDAQSFRVYDEFKEDSYEEYMRVEGTRKLRVVPLKAYIYHYGHARPPRVMSNKRKQTFGTFHGKRKGEKLLKKMPDEFDYGPLNRIPTFKGTHPKVMEEWMKDFHWKEKLQYSGSPNKYRQKHKHEKLKYRLVSFIENTFNGGDPMWSFQNFEIVKRKK